MHYRFIQSFPYLLNRVGVRLGELFSERLRDDGITLPMYRVLAVLQQEGPQRLTDLSNMVSIEPSTLSRLVGTLTQNELATRNRLEDNARTVRIDITQKGSDLVDKLIPLAAEYERTAVESFTPEQVEEMKAHLVAIHENLYKLEELNKSLKAQKS